MKRPVADADKIFMYKLTCSGSETNIGLCHYAGWGYGGPACRQIAMVSCQKGNISHIIASSTVISNCLLYITNMKWLLISH